MAVITIDVTVYCANEERARLFYSVCSCFLVAVSVLCFFLKVLYGLGLSHFLVILICFFFIFVHFTWIILLNCTVPGLQWWEDNNV